MTGPDERACPPEVLAAVPWYPDELSRDEREAVDAHAATCPECRRELEIRLGEVLAEEAPLPDPEAAFTHVLSQIETDEAEKLHDWARAPRRKRAVRWLREREVQVPGTGATISVSRGLSAAASFGVLLAAIGLFVGVGPGNGETPAGGPVLDVVFRRDLPAAEMAAVLGTVDGEIVAGPSPGGRYRVRLPEGADPDAVARRLAEDRTAVYAEPAR